MSPGSQTFEQDLFRLVRQGKISTDEALANADSATNLGLLLGNSGIMPAMAERAKNPAALARAPPAARRSASSRSRRSPPTRASADARRREEPRGKPHAVRGVPPGPPQHRDPLRRHPAHRLRDRAGARHSSTSRRATSRVTLAAVASRRGLRRTTSGSTSRSAPPWRPSSSLMCAAASELTARLPAGGALGARRRALRGRLGPAVLGPPLRGHEARVLRRREAAPHRAALRVRRGVLLLRGARPPLRRYIEERVGPTVARRRHSPATETR